MRPGPEGNDVDVSVKLSAKGVFSMKFSTIVLTVAMTVVSPALAQKVDVDYAHQENFSAIASYKWGKNEGQLPDALEDTHIRNKIDRILQSKGLRRVDSGPANLVITYQATMMTQQQVDTYQDDPDIGLGYGWGWGMDGDGDGVMTSAIPAVKSSTFKEGISSWIW
jgi:Domain of unknown function (DUF4136)